MPKDVSRFSIDKIYKDVRVILTEARAQAYRSVNAAMVQAYWHTGRLIVEEKQSGKRWAEYGTYLLKEKWGHYALDSCRETTGSALV